MQDPIEFLPVGLSGQIRLTTKCPIVPRHDAAGVRKSGRILGTDPKLRFPHGIVSFYDLEYRRTCRDGKALSRIPRGRSLSNWQHELSRLQPDPGITMCAPLPVSHVGAGRCDRGWTRSIIVRPVPCYSSKACHFSGDRAWQPSTWRAKLGQEVPKNLQSSVAP